MGRPVVHFEIGCRDGARTGKFYGELFDWKITAAGPAQMIATGSDKGIQGHFTSLGHEPHDYVTFYVEVEDLEGTLERVVALGGSKVIGPIPIPTGRFAWIKDPEGNLIGLMSR